MLSVLKNGTLRSARPLWGAATLGLTALSAVPAEAGGGAHIVDDDAVLDPGVCHSEQWLTHKDANNGLVTVAPACTFASLPRLELAIAVQHIYDPDNATTITPGAKLNLRSHTETGVGMAVSAAVVWNADDRRVDAVQFNLPVSIRATKRLTVHGNLGWVITPAETDQHALFWGAQAEYFLSSDLVLMGEVFGLDKGAAGSQAGLRWVMDRGRIDFDILAGHNVDGAGSNSFTLGLTIRR